MPERKATALQKRAQKEQALINGTAKHVLDAETGEIVELTDAQRRYAADLQRQIESLSLLTGIFVLKMRDEKAYLGLGCSSFSEWCETKAPFSRSGAYMYIAIGERFAPILRKFSSEVVHPGGQLGDGNDDSEALEKLSSLGMKRLYELTKLAEPTFEEVAEKGRLVMPDGETSYSFEELKAMKTREVAQIVKQSRMDKKKYLEHIARLEEENKKLESEGAATEKENLQLKAENEELKSRVRHRELYDGKDKSYDQQREVLQRADDLYMELQSCLMNSGVTTGSPEPLQEKLMDLIWRVGHLGKRGFENHYEIGLLMDERLREAGHYSGGYAADRFKALENNALDPDVQAAQARIDNYTIRKYIHQVLKRLPDGSITQSPLNSPPPYFDDSADSLEVMLGRGWTLEPLPRGEGGYRLVHEENGWKTEPSTNKDNLCLLAVNIELADMAQRAESGEKIDWDMTQWRTPTYRSEVAGGDGAPSDR